MSNDAVCASAMPGRFPVRPAAPRVRAQSGFTLVELMTTLVVLAMLAAVALPSFRSFVQGQRIKSASFDTMSALTLARAEAIKRNTNVDIIPAGGSWLNGWTVAAGATVLKRQSPLQNGLSVTCFAGAAAAPCGTVTYQGSGRLAPGSAAPSVLIASVEPGAAAAAAARCIGVDLSGRPRSTKGGCA